MATVEVTGQMTSPLIPRPLNQDLPTPGTPHSQPYYVCGASPLLAETLNFECPAAGKTDCRVVGVA